MKSDIAVGIDMETAEIDEIEVPWFCRFKECYKLNKQFFNITVGKGPVYGVTAVGDERFHEDRDFKIVMSERNNILKIAGIKAQDTVHQF